MVQVRKLVLAIAAASALSSGMAQALGLGELSVKSTLNQPLVAEIELTEAQGLNATQVVPSLATTADFAQAGVTRQAFLNDLTFTPVINASGKSVLRITSSKPVREPYVKFLVQVLWPNGRLLREYSLLLDPPKFSPEAAAAAAAAAAAPAPAAAPAAPAQLATVAPSTEAAAPEAPAPAASAPVLPPPAADKQAQYVTANNDTLWEIAAKVRTGGTVQQTMLAIQALNPEAFIGGNINRLKKGQVLRLPTPQQTTALPQPQAVAEVSRQYSAWREGRRLPAGTRQVDATRRDRAGAAPSKVDTSDNLSLVSASGKPAAKGAAGDSDLGNKLAVAQEALDTTRRDNAELKSRMNDLQSQLDKLQRLIELKNGQLAKMQAAGAAVPPAAATPEATTPANAAVPASLVDANGAPVKPAGEIAPEDALPAGAAEVATPAADQPLAVEPVAAAEDEDVLQKILNNPVLLGLIGGAVLLILALLLLFLARRRAAKAEAEKHKRMARALAEESDFVSDMDMNAPPASFDGLDVPPPNVRMGAAGAAAATAARERPADPLLQAEIHIAYGRMNQAVELLEEAVKEDPKRDDIRLKLMEIYAEQGNNKAYAAHERKLVAAGKREAEVEQQEELNSTLKPVAPVAAPAVSESATASAAPAVAAAAAAASAAALVAELDAKYVEELLADDSAEQEVEPEPEVAVTADPEPAPEVVTPLAAEPAEEADPFDHDFDLSLDEFEEAPTPEVTTVNELDDLMLDEPKVQAAADDEELSFESIMQQQEEARAATTPEDLADFDLDLSEEDPALKNEDDFLLGLGSDPLDLGETPSVPPVSDDLELPEDFDLSLADEIETDQASQAFATEIDDVNAELDRLSQNLEHPPLDEPRFTAEDAAALDDEPDFDFMAGTDEAATKLDLARAYIDMGDADGARDILDEVVTEGDDGQKSEAREMLSRLA
ncbi:MULTISPECIES: FimV/HubP family polar landmark protein [Pseudomonas syringae group]|uniref:FimV/HubP family polar landmark protein n=1 Tax=Pseudomonas syringae group TaxID=136849 RepID=UPI000C08BF22|nr:MULTISPECIES: FimV/HubP family polar landmark protein [Pseudomonas syringae group]PHN74902.1 peptidoglycan-binding protein [Pseudomonas syringae pv. cerasicola]PHN75840.1 peptidoglycan-binding protein [Pseudomonas syringae pv. cerasicola]RMT50958.1 LysM domain-containing protein [Pseudomonas savastanoi]SPF16528.1 peptidoglycan-binding protein [Pseudomonas syringae pv. cerasicola]